MLCVRVLWGPELVGTEQRCQGSTDITIILNPQGVHQPMVFCTKTKVETVDNWALQSWKMSALPSKMGEFLSHGGTPIYHPFINFLWNKYHPAVGGIPMVQRHCWQVDSRRRERRQRDGEGGNLSVEGRITWGNVLKKYAVEIMKMYSPTYGGVLSHGGTPSYHPCYFRIFHCKPSSCWGTTMTMETSIYRKTRRCFRSANAAAMVCCWEKGTKKAASPEM